MGKYACMICDDKVACQAIDESLEKGMTYAALARLMTLRGFTVSAPTLSQHDKHRKPIAPPGVATRKKDLAILVRDKTIEAIENGDLDITDDKAWKNVGPGLQAQKLLDTRAAKSDDRKLAFTLGMLLAGGEGGFVAPPQLTGGDDYEGITEGEFEELPVE